jgi:ribose-phosphate pyrophosphokinase
MIDTGGTAQHACEILKQKGLEKVIGCFTHAIFSNGAVDKMNKSAYDHIFVTDTIDFDKALVASEKISIVSVRDFLCDYVKKMFE